MPKPFPPEFRRDVIAVARKGEASMSQVARDFGISESRLQRWLKIADRENGLAPPSSSSGGGDDSAELRKLRWGVGFVVVLSVIAVLMLAVLRNDPLRGPAAPYAHRGFSEVSVATEDVGAGQAKTVVDGLEDRGYWCVQPRSNDLALQIACQSPERDIDVDVVVAPGGDVLYADIDLGLATASTSSRSVEDRLRQVLDASFLRLWPQDRATIDELLEDAQPDPFMPFGQEAPPTDPAKQHSTHEQRTDNASWSLWSFYTGEPLALRVRTTGLEDRTWPFGGSHYATSVNAATTKLVADGFTCASSCHRSSDGQTVDFDEHDGQIVTARFTLRSSANEADRRTDPSGQWVRAGLPLLTPAVQAAIGQRVEECRNEQRSWRGVIAGTPVDIIAVPGADLMVTIGLPLLFVE